MTDPVQFPASTPRYSLPLLFSGQAQKEFFVNAALSRCDALLHPVVEGEIAVPPADPAEDQCWLVSSAASDAFAGREGDLAIRQAGEWIFVAPRDGLRVFDRSTSQFLLYVGTWRREPAVAAPSDGQTVDVEARFAIGQLIGVLKRCGILADD